MADIHDLAQDIEAEAPHLAPPEITRMLRSTIRDFCQRSKVWRETYEIETTADEDRIFLPTPSDAMVEEVHSVSKGDEVIEPGSATLAYRIRQPMYWYDENGLNLSPVPNIVEALEVVVSLYPKRGSDQLPEHLIERYGDAIVGGVLSKVFDQKDRPWYSRSRADRLFMEYERAILDAFADGEQDHTCIPLVTSYGGL